MPFARYCDRQNTSHALYLRRFAFARTQPDKLVYLHPDCQPTRTAMRPPSSFRTLCARHIRNFAAKAHTRPLLPPNCRSMPRPDSFGSLYSRKRCRGAHFFAFSFHVEHTPCHSPKPQHLSRFLLVYAYLYIASLHVFRLSVCFFRPCDPFPVAAPRLTIAPRRRSLTPGSASRRVARVPSHRFAFAFRFSAVVLPLFDFSISFCLMLHGAPQTFCLFFLCLRLFALSLQ